jgi:hypothetical protein
MKEMYMKFEDLITTFGKPLHELTDAEVDSIISKLDSTELERFSAHLKKETKKSNPRKLSRTAKSNLDEFDKILLGTADED